jgi:hypothetical protein
MKQLLCESFPLFHGIVEGKTENGVYKLKGLFHLAETKNANGRIYPKSLLKREIDRIQENINGRAITGEIDHPSDPMPRLQGAACVVTEARMEGNKVFGTLEALKTPNGMVLEGLIRSGVRLGISSRGVGSLSESEDGTKLVQDDYQLLTWDVVPNPSTPDAWLGENAHLFNPEPSVYEREDFKVIDLNTKNESNNKINDIEGYTELYIRDKVSKLFGG